MGTVCAAALLGGLVDLDVLDDEVAGVKTLGVGVGLGVLEEREEELSALHGPAGLGDTELLAFNDANQYCCSNTHCVCCPAMALFLFSLSRNFLRVSQCSVCILAHG